MTMQIDTVEDMFVHELQGVYHMERRLVDILDEMASNATNENISLGFADHRDETREHVERVEGVFQAMNVQPEERQCPIVEALDEERMTVENNTGNPELINLFYLGAGMKTERIELTAYDSLLAMADQLGLGNDVTDLLEANRKSEKRTLDELQTLSTASDLKQLWNKLMP